MQVSKEYNDRWVKPLVNKGFTIDEYNNSKRELELDFEQFVHGVNSIPSMSDGDDADCNCKSLLHGHANECPRGKS